MELLNYYSLHLRGEFTEMFFTKVSQYRHLFGASEKMDYSSKAS